VIYYLGLRLRQERDDGFRRAQPAHAENLQSKTGNTDQQTRDGKPDSMEQRNGGGGERTFTCSWRNLTYSMISSSMDALSVCTGETQVSQTDLLQSTVIRQEIAQEHAFEYPVGVWNELL